MRRADITKGQGLSPLRFQRAAEAQGCDDLGPCTYLALGQVEIGIGIGTSATVPGGELARLSITASHKAADTSVEAPPVRLTWEEVVATGGLSVYLDKGELIMRHPKPCGQRLWSPCAPDQPTSTQPAS